MFHPVFIVFKNWLCLGLPYIIMHNESLMLFALYKNKTKKTIVADLGLGL